MGSRVLAHRSVVDQSDVLLLSQASQSSLVMGLVMSLDQGPC